MKLAIFDIDGTLVHGSSERMFWRFLLDRRRQGPRQIFGYLLFLVRYVWIGGVHTVKKNKAYLCGLAATEVAALAEEFVETRLLRELYEPVVQRVRQHLGRGDVVVLMSGTLQPIAQALAKHCGVEHLSATLPNQRDGRFTGQPPDVHPFDTAKLALATEFAARHGLDLAQAAAYGDSRHDLALLRAVGEPVAVLPDRSLLREALERGWEVVPSNHATEREFRFTKPQRSRYM